MNISDLPPEIWAYILSFLSYGEKTKVSEIIPYFKPLIRPSKHDIESARKIQQWWGRYRGHMDPSKITYLEWASVLDKDHPEVPPLITSRNEYFRWNGYNSYIFSERNFVRSFDHNGYVTDTRFCWVLKFVRIQSTYPIRKVKFQANEWTFFERTMNLKDFVLYPIPGGIPMFLIRFMWVRICVEPAPTENESVKATIRGIAIPDSCINFREVCDCAPCNWCCPIMRFGGGCMAGPYYGSNEWIRNLPEWREIMGWK